MKYFSGFCLTNEHSLFASWLIVNDFTVSGFSFGAQKALQYALSCQTRIDKLQLFSPAFFNNKDEKFKRMQLMFWQKNQEAYIQNFLENCSFPKTNMLQQYLNGGTFLELQELLNYQWNTNNLQQLVNKNIKIEVFVGELDKIVDAYAVVDFFKPFADVYCIKNVGHIL